MSEQDEKRLATASELAQLVRTYPGCGGIARPANMGLSPLSVTVQLCAEVLAGAPERIQFNPKTGDYETVDLPGQHREHRNW